MLKLLNTIGSRLDPQRSDMRRACAELVTAQKEHAELEAKLSRLNAVIADAEAADAAFHRAVAADGDGAALAEFADGNAPDGDIAKIVGRAQKTAPLAAAARAAAPKVQGRLDELRGQITSLEYERNEAVFAYLRKRAKVAQQDYIRPLAALCNVYDQIVGMRRALRMKAPEPLRGPRFDDPQFPTMERTGRGSEAENASHARWTEARRRLDDDPDALIDDLIGSAPEDDAA